MLFVLRDETLSLGKEVLCREDKSCLEREDEVDRCNMPWLLCSLHGKFSYAIGRGFGFGLGGGLGGGWKLARVSVEKSPTFSRSTSSISSAIIFLWRSLASATKKVKSLALGSLITLATSKIWSVRGVFLKPFERAVVDRDRPMELADNETGIMLLLLARLLHLGGRVDIEEVPLWKEQAPTEARSGLSRE